MQSEPQETDLDRLFADAADDMPSDQLMARVLADASAVQAKARPAVAATPPTPWWREVLDAIGGWPTLSGATAAGVMGVMIGIYAPDLVDGLSGGQLLDFSDSYSVAPDLGGLAWEDGNV